MRSVAFLLVAGLALSGCTVPFIGGDGLEGTFTRAVVFDIDAATMARLESVADPADALQDMTSAKFTYTHQGQAMDVEGLTVRFTGDDGLPKAVPLSDYTTAGTLSRGDSVVIDEVAMTSSVSIGDGDVSVTRQGVRADWLQALGYPLPLAAKPGDEASWSYDLKLDLDAGVTRAHEADGGLRDGTVDTHLDMQGTFGFATRPAGDGMDMDLRLSMDGLLDLLVEATLLAEGTETPMGADIDAEATFEGLLALGFGPQRLETAAASGAIRSDGTVYVWDDQHLRSERWEPDGIEHPFIDETFPATTIPVETAVTALETVVMFLDDLYAMDLAPGDSFTMNTDIDMFLARLQSTYEVRVTAQDDKTVAAGTFDTLRLQSTQEVLFQVGTQSLALPLIQSTVWLERDTYLPIAARSEVSLRLDADDLSPLTNVAGASGMTIEGPFLHLVSSAEMELLAHAGEPRVAGALLGAGNALVMPLMAPFAALGGLPPASFEPQRAPTPDYTFQADEETDRLTLVEVQGAQAWEELVMETTAPIHFALDREATSADPDTYWGAPIQGGEVMAGQYLSFCAADGAEDVTVRIMFAPAGETVYVGTFGTVDAC